MAAYDIIKEKKISKLLTYAEQKLSKKQYTLFSEFSVRFFVNLSDEFLQYYDMKSLFSIVRSALLGLKRKTPADFFSHLLPLSHHAERMGLMIVGRDLPFMVDSIRILLSRYDITVHDSISLGGLCVQTHLKDALAHIACDSFNNIPDVQGQKSAVLYFEIDYIVDTDKRALLLSELTATLQDVCLAYTDWSLMKQKMADVIEGLAMNPGACSKKYLASVLAYLDWLLDNQFTFLGYRKYRVVKRGSDHVLQLVKDSGLGVLKNEKNSLKSRSYSSLPKAAQRDALSAKSALILTKTNTKSTVHRSVYSDYVGVKIFNSKGKVVGEHRFIGLYTSSVYTCPPHMVPFLREKIHAVMKRANLDPNGHAGKGLMHILSNLPRDDLFHAPVAQIFDLSMSVLRLKERHIVKLFLRKDVYNRYVSAFVYMPRENFNTKSVHKIQKILLTAFAAKEATTHTFFSESTLVRIHYNIRLGKDAKVRVDQAYLEEQVTQVALSWHDQLKTALIEKYGAKEGMRLSTKYKYSFSPGFSDATVPALAVYDVEQIELLHDAHELMMSFFNDKEGICQYHFKLYRKGVPVLLSEAVPMLENMGLTVFREQPFKITLKTGGIVWVNDFSLSAKKSISSSIDEVREIFKQAFYRIWHKDVADDGFNQLVLSAGLNWKEISLLRAYTKYCKQIGFTFSVEYIINTFVKHSAVVRALVQYFSLKFDVAVKQREAVLAKQHDGIKKLLKSVRSLDDDRILRMYFRLIIATLRTNYYQDGCLKSRKPYLSLKFDSALVPNLPLPLPRYEVFVYSTLFEGIHLRADKVARGGLRWSDRPEDFRTEVLGLMKAQQVKNALIVPAGAKGGFVPKKLHDDMTRDERLIAGKQAYEYFISALLDITDNVVNKKIVSPKNTVIYDDRDPYLVVAADKGTATFSDTANTIALAYDFWLGDAFASGGSCGYDHKKMGITARGAWVSAERHFQDIGIDLNNAVVTVVGIGDMAGDVFGNGILLSKKLKLVAAFDHRHIFVDPNPDPLMSFTERQRLFNLDKSSWADYDPAVLSRGGAVFSRQDKSIKLSASACKMLNISDKELQPDKLIQAILTAPVDMIWNGGVGTFVKASSERHLEVNDRTNNLIRVDANALNAKVFSEGGNLGMTQLARVEFEFSGGRVNTDFIDNSAGVDCSDHEVNIKILLAAVMRETTFSLKERNKLLTSMGKEVAKLVLKNNYDQNQSISMASRISHYQIDMYIRYIDYLESEFSLNREVSFLPTTETLHERKMSAVGLTRPEISVLLSYGKNTLKKALIESGVLKDPALQDYLLMAFPDVLAKKFGAYFATHRLAPEIIATQLSNKLFAEMSTTFVYRMYEETGAEITEIIKAYVVASQVFHMSDIVDYIDALDFKLPSVVQYSMLYEAVRVVRRATLWFLRNRPDGINIKKELNKFVQPVEFLFDRLPKLLLGKDRDGILYREEKLLQKKVPDDIAFKVANARPTYHALNITEVANVHKIALHKVAKVYFILSNHLELLWLRDVLLNYPANTRWTVLSKAGLKSDLDYVQRQLVVNVLTQSTATRSSTGLVSEWIAAYQSSIDLCKATVAEFHNNANNFDLLTVSVRQLLELARVSR